MKDRRNSFVATEGIPFLLLALLAAAVGWRLGDWPFALPGLLVSLWLYFVFRDPTRSAPPAALGVVSPVDGVVRRTGVSTAGIVDDEVHTILIRINSLGTYTARSPVEGKIMDLNGELPRDRAGVDSPGLWLHTDEKHDVVMQFRGYRFGLPPASMLSYGERVGQGERCASLRFTRYAELQLPLASRLLVQNGQRVRAGSDLLARLPHR